MAEKEKEKEPNDRLQRSAQHAGLRVLGQSKLPKLKEHQEERKSDFDVFQVKDYHEKKYEGGEEEKSTTTDRVEVAKDGLGLILERWGCLFILIFLKAIKH